MDTTGRARLQKLLALTSEGRTSSMLELLAARTVTALAVSGAGITVFSDLGGAAAPHRGLVSATNPVSHQLDELQLTVGEGPSLDAFQSGSPVLIADSRHRRCPLARVSAPPPASAEPPRCSPSPA